MRTRAYGKASEVAKIPDLRDLQFKSYSRFLQKDVPPAKRHNIGLEAIIREIFPIKSYDGSLSLVYLSYDLGRPRYEPDDCRKLRLTYGAPFKILVRLEKEEPIEEEVYLGELPLMIGGGEFIINGAERVIVNQLHRSPGVDFSEEIHSLEKRLHSFRIIPERGSWIEANVTKKENLVVRIDQSGKFPATILLRAMDEAFSTNQDIIRVFHETEKIKLSGPGCEVRARGRRSAQDVVNPETGELILEAGDEVPEKGIRAYREMGLKDLEVIKGMPDLLILNTLKEDPTRSHTDALLRIYQRLRPGNPAQKEKAADLFADKFFNSNKYRLGRVGRFRLNRKFSQKISEKEMTLRPEDFLNAIRYVLDLRGGTGEIDDIDHLGNRRVRTIDELAGDELRKGFLKLKRTIQERMSLMDPETISPRSVINSKTISSAIEYFFGRGELSQVVDQTNPLAQLTHERRLSALGPGGLNRKRAGFEVRDVHISHYGRICPIETPEGTNIGLISSLAIYASTDPYGFLITPYHVVRNGRLRDEITFLRADEEENAVLAPADTPIDEQGKIIGRQVLARINGEFRLMEPKAVQYMDISPKQLVGVSASLIPFLEHNDANRALMGSNMQRQAVPLLQSEPPIVGTGMEGPVARNSGMVVLSPADGVVTKCDASQIVVSDEHSTKLRKFVGLNERTCLNQKPIVEVGQTVKKGQMIADGAATHNGELALGKNVLVGFMPWDGYNFEDAILVSEKLVKEDRYTSIHIEEFEIEIRETKLGREEFTRDIPNVAEKALRNLDESGIVRIGTRVKPGDILVGKVVPKSKTELSPEEKLLHAIFGRAGEDVKNDSLEVPSGVEGIVIDAKKFSRKSQMSESERHKNRQLIRAQEKEYETIRSDLVHRLMVTIKEEFGGNLRDKVARREIRERDLIGLDVAEIKMRLDYERFEPPAASRTRSKLKVFELIRRYLDEIEDAESRKNLAINRIQRGDELPTGVLELVKVYVATRRVLSVGDKMAGRHGNKGVIAKILPEEDMPFLEDGTPLDMLLNPLGVPSRMNVGQIMETHLGWAAKILGFQVVSPVFGGCTEAEIRDTLREAGLPEDGKVVLYDGRTGAPLDQKVTVGYLYTMKLHHLVDDKVHARATGPYSLITQQPLGGKARFGGQRFGEMEVWALEAYGAANILQELLTVKSDDVDGRTKIYESMVKGENTLEPGTPVSFDVLTNEIKGLGLNMVLNKKRV